MKDYEKEFIKEVKNLTSFVNFKCDCFDRPSTLFVDDRPIEIKGGGCCTDCYRTLGYGALREHNMHKFRKRIGFWRKNKGCVLDRSERSIICINYSCKPLTKQDSIIRDIVRRFIYEEFVPAKKYPNIDRYLHDKFPKVGGNLQVAHVHTKETKIEWPDIIDNETRSRIMRLRILALKNKQS